MKLRYFLLDVFTDMPLEGNPLAVITKADHLGDKLMQKIAKEFNLSETVFLLQPEFERHSALARIFTPAAELPFAGHPTIGAAVLLGLQQRASAVRLEEQIGLITCVMEAIDSKTGEAHFKLPQLPVETGAAPDKKTIAETLGITQEDIGYAQFQPTKFSAGLEFTLVPVRDRQVLANINLEKRGWEDVYGDEHPAVYVFTPTPNVAGQDFAARMFDPHLYAAEDPGTGSAVAALIGYLAKYGEKYEGQRSFIVSQGCEMGRPSRIEMQIGFVDGALKHAGIGGKAVLVGEGELNLEKIEWPNLRRPVVDRRK